MTHPVQDKRISQQKTIFTSVNQVQPKGDDAHRCFYSITEYSNPREGKFAHMVSENGRKTTVLLGEKVACSKKFAPRSNTNLSVYLINH